MFFQNLARGFPGHLPRPHAGGPFHATYQCLPVAFLEERERVSAEYGGKILLPQAALEQLAEQVSFPSIRHVGHYRFRTASCYSNCTIKNTIELRIAVFSSFYRPKRRHAIYPIG